MKPKIFIDGREGTTGLQIYDRLAGRDDLDLLVLSEAERKDTAARAKMINAADIVFLCLPDAAAREAVTLVDNDLTRVIDASTAHRTAEGWDYGFAELSPAHRAAIEQSRRVANPGCHASGFIAAVYPLISRGLLPPTYPLTCFSLTGYSGGGKKMIAEYEADAVPEGLRAPRLYGLNLHHKHLPEMQKVCGLAFPPVFTPVVDDYYKGMATSIQLHNDLLAGETTASLVHEVLAEHYAGQPLVTVDAFSDGSAMIAANEMAGRDSLRLIVSGDADRTIVTALFDNLGKGASGAAVQNMNLMLGLDPTTGLHP